MRDVLPRGRVPRRLQLPPSPGAPRPAPPRADSDPESGCNAPERTIRAAGGAAGARGLDGDRHPDDLRRGDSAGAAGPRQGRGGASAARGAGARPARPGVAVRRPAGAPPGVARGGAGQGRGGAPSPPAGISALGARAPRPRRTLSWSGAAAAP